MPSHDEIDPQNPLLVWAGIYQKNAQIFSAAHEDLSEMINCIFTSARIMARSAEKNDLEIIDFIKVTLWLDAINHQVLALQEVIAGRLSDAFSIMRLSTELARDIAVLDEEKLDIWKNRRENHNKFKKMFKFRESDPLTYKVKYFYDFCSNFGTHGHLTNLVNLSKAGILEKNDESFFLLHYGHKNRLKNVEIVCIATITINRSIKNSLSKSGVQFSDEALVIWDEAFSMVPHLSEEMDNIRVLSDAEADQIWKKASTDLHFLNEPEFLH